MEQHRTVSLRRERSFLEQFSHLRASPRPHKHSDFLTIHVKAQTPLHEHRHRKQEAVRMGESIPQKVGTESSRTAVSD